MCPIDLAKYTLEKDAYHVVKDGKIETRYGIQDIDLPDGAYVIRKLKPIECERLQTMPDGYTEGIADSQRYKCLGNGWTAEVIKFILSHMQIPKDEPIVVLSMFDGIATGRYVLESLGFTNITYYAYEIDEFAKAVAMKNYPDIIQLGDAFDVRKEGWSLEHAQTQSTETPAEVKEVTSQPAENIQETEPQKEPEPTEEKELMESRPLQIIPESINAELVRLRTERDLYRKLYNELLENITKGARA
jgi:hypothetical protein